jgi:hypothetical protein
MMVYTPQTWDRANDNIFFKLGTIRLGVIGCLTLCKHRATPITTQMCSYPLEPTNFTQADPSATFDGVALCPLSLPSDIHLDSRGISFDKR